MPKRYNVSGHDLVIDWGTGVIPHGGSIDVPADDEMGPDWSSNASDVQRVATAGGDGLDDATKAAYAKSRKTKSSTEAAPTTDGTAPVDAATSDAASIDPAPADEATTPAVPADTKES